LRELGRLPQLLPDYRAVWDESDQALLSPYSEEDPPEDGRYAPDSTQPDRQPHHPHHMYARVFGPNPPNDSHVSFHHPPTWG
jgi:hypothetical protein